MKKSLLVMCLLISRLAAPDHIFSYITSVRGKVENKSSGEPIAEANLDLITLGGSLQVYSAVTNSTGEYQVEVYIPTTYEYFDPNDYSCGTNCYYDTFGFYVCQPFGCYRNESNLLQVCASAPNFYKTACDFRYLSYEFGQTVQVDLKLEEITDADLLPGACKIEDAKFRTVTDGCEDITTGLVWGAISPNKMTWTDATQYCPAGWRLPTSLELRQVTKVKVTGILTHFNFDVLQRFWSSQVSGRTRAWAVRLSNGKRAKVRRTVPNSVVCVRN